MAGFQKIKSSAITVGRATSQALWRRVRSNFASHEDRISDLEAAPTIFPTGSVAKFGGAAAPTGWLLLHGQVVSRTTYADLFAIMGTAWNTGGEAGTDFRLPDGRGRTFIASGTGAGLTARTRGDYVGSETHTLSAAEMPTHNHSPTDPGHTHTVPSEETIVGGTADNFCTPSSFANSGPNAGLTTNSATTGITVGDAGGGAAHNNMQPSLVVNWIVKT